MSPVPNTLKTVFNYIDKNKDTFIGTLKTAVSIKSVSAFKENRDDVVKMMNWAADKLTSLKVQVEICDVGKQKLHDGSTIDLPPILLGSLGNDKNKPTVCVYGHLDVQPAQLSDGWDTEPFELTLKNGKMYGRGSSDDKGPALSWLHVVEAFQQTNSELPVNLKFCYEGMEESGSDGLDELLLSRKDTFFQNVDYICISDNYWLGTTKPCVTYGLRGLCYFFVEVSCSSKDLHSGLYGGTITEAMSDLVAILNTLVDKDGKIQIPGIMDDVEELTDKEKNTYSTIDFDTEAYRADLGAPQLIHDTKEDVLMARWRYPSLSIHGIEGAFSESGCKTVIPRKVTGKFSIRIVPHQKPEKIETLVKEHIARQWKLRGSPNTIKGSVFKSAIKLSLDYNAESQTERKLCKKTLDFMTEKAVNTYNATYVSLLKKCLDYVHVRGPKGRGSEYLAEYGEVSVAFIDYSAINIQLRLSGGDRGSSISAESSRKVEVVDRSNLCTLLPDTKWPNYKEMTNVMHLVVMQAGNAAWKSDPHHKHYNAAKNAINLVYNVVPDLTREGGSIPVALTFQDIIEKNVLLLPMGCGDDGAHSQNEKLDVTNYIEGTKMMAAYLYEVGMLGKSA